MNKKRLLLINFVLISALVLANCGPVTQVPIPTPTILPTEMVPDVQVQEDQVAPSIVEQIPPAGQRLDPSSEIRLVFDRTQVGQVVVDDIGFSAIDPAYLAQRN